MKKFFLTGLVVAFGLIMIGGCNSSTSEKKQEKQSVTKEQPAKKDRAKTKATSETKAATENKAVPDEGKRQKVKISTKYGDMIVELYNGTPLHRDNFIKLVKEGYYDGTLFHRVIKDFMIQGGDPDSKNAKPGQRLGMGGPGYTIPAEIKPEYYHKKGAVAAARKGDQMNPEKRSSGSQFYIVEGKKYTPVELNNMAKRNDAHYTAEQIHTYQTVGGTPFLDNEYTVFGQVVEGLDVIDKIASVKTGAGNRPVEDIVMNVTLIDN